MAGSIYIAFLQCTAAGKMLHVKQEKVDLRLTNTSYQNALTNGFALSRELPLQRDAEQLRIAVCDGFSDNIGSVTIPLKK
jgi:hypothetical protein